MNSAEKAGYKFDGILCGREADSLRWCGEASEKGSGREAVCAGDECVEAFEREGEVGSALVVGYGVDFVDDDGADAAKIFARFARGEQDVERLRRGDEDVGRISKHGGAFFRERVAGADAGANLGAEIAAFNSEALDLGQWAVEVFLDVVRECFERADVDDLRARR